MHSCSLCTAIAKSGVATSVPVELVIGLLSALIAMLIVVVVVVIFVAMIVSKKRKATIRSLQMEVLSRYSGQNREG